MGSHAGFIVKVSVARQCSNICCTGLKSYINRNFGAENAIKKKTMILLKVFIEKHIHVLPGVALSGG